MRRYRADFGGMVRSSRNDAVKSSSSDCYDEDILKLCLKELSRWMAPQKAETSMTTFPSSAEIISEPLGVVLVISTWNYPFLLSLDPVIEAIAAGNAVVLKPSEVAPTTSSVLAKPSEICEFLFDPCFSCQVEAMKSELEVFYGKYPFKSPDLSCIVNSNHFNCLPFGKKISSVDLNKRPDDFNKGPDDSLKESQSTCIL